MRLLLVTILGLSLTACLGFLGGDGSDFPDLSEVPERRETTLTPERREEITQELTEARDRAASHAAEGRRSTGASEGDDSGEDVSEDVRQDDGEPE